MEHYGNAHERIEELQGLPVEVLRNICTSNSLLKGFDIRGKTKGDLVSLIAENESIFGKRLEPNIKRRNRGNSNGEDHENEGEDMPESVTIEDILADENGNLPDVEIVSAPRLTEITDTAKPSNGKKPDLPKPPPGSLEATLVAAILPYLESKAEIDEAQILELTDSLQGKIDSIGALLLGELAIARTEIHDSLKGVIEEAIKAAKRLPRPIVIKYFETGDTSELGLQHHMFEELLLLAQGRFNVWLTGPAGGGKTHVCHSIAKALKIPFYPQSVGAQTTKSDLVGFVDANGKYVKSPMYMAMKDGGLYLIDEADAGNSNVLTIINAALSNGHYLFPNGELVEKHKDFVCFAAANTFGRGADRLYVGRNQLDAATLNRFEITDFDYDESLELALALQEWEGAAEWVHKVQAWRKRAWELKERIVISPRASISGARMLGQGFKEKRVEQLTVWKGIDRAIIKKIKQSEGDD